MSGSRSLSPVPSIDNCDAMNLSIVSSESDDLVDDDDMDESSLTPEWEEADERYRHQQEEAEDSWEERMMRLMQMFMPSVTDGR